MCILCTIWCILILFINIFPLNWSFILNKWLHYDEYHYICSVLFTLTVYYYLLLQ